MKQNFVSVLNCIFFRINYLNIIKKEVLVKVLYNKKKIIQEQVCISFFFCNSGKSNLISN